jgi:hypothetical protein
MWIIVNDRRFGLTTQAPSSFIASAGTVVSTLDVDNGGTSTIAVTSETR